MLILVNLDSAIERRELMSSQLEQLDVEFRRVGIDMRLRSDEQIVAWVDAHFAGVAFDLESLSGAEAGCWLSHLSAWRHLLDQDREQVCVVIEDDLILATDFADAVTSLQSQSAFDVVYLGTSSRNLSTRRRTRIGPLWAHEPVGAVYNTWGYAVTRQYVRRFFDRAPMRLDVPIDHFLGGNSAPGAPRISVLQPAVVREHPTLGAASQIGPHTRRLDRWRMVERARRRLLSSRVSSLYYSLYRLL